MVTFEARDGGYQGTCTCGWRSALLGARTEAARAALQHAANSSCHARIGGRPRAGLAV